MRNFTLIAALCVGLWAIAYRLPLPALPDTLREPRERAAYAALHFCDALDHEPADSLTAEVWHQSVADLLSFFPHIANDSICAMAAERLVDAGRRNDAWAADISSALESCLFDGASPQRDEKLFALFLKLMADAAYPDAERCRWLLSMVEKNMPGSTAPDFAFTDRSGAARTLHASLGRPTVLFFYDPECDDCHHAAAQMASDIILQSRLGRGAAQIIAITTADIDSWRKSAGQFPDAWTDGHNDGSIDDDDLFFIPSYPTFYLLDSDGTIVLKDAPYSRIISVLTAM